MSAQYIQSLFVKFSITEKHEDFCFPLNSTKYGEIGSHHDGL